MSTRFQSKKGDRPENIEVFCNECDEIISEEDKNTINCDLCRKWYHKGCTTIKSAEWKVLSSNPNILYSCDICLEKKGNEATEMREIKEMFQVHLRETRKLMTSMEDKINKNVERLIDEKLAIVVVVPLLSE